MATIRELVAKLGFEVDTKPAEKFQQTITGVKNALNTLLVAKGLTVGSRLEDSFLEAQRKIEYLSGTRGLGALNDALNMVTATASQIDIAAAMREGIEVTSDPQFTKQMVQFGAMMADAFGGSLQSNMHTLIQGALGGNFSALVPSGLFTQQEAEFLSGVNINSVQGKLLIINKLEEKRLKLTKAREKSLLTGGVQTDRLIRNIENLGKKIGEYVNPVIGKALSYINELFETFIGSKSGMMLAKVAAIAGGISVLAGAIMSAKVVFGTFSALMAGGFGSALATAFLLAGTLLVLEDIWKTLNGEKDTYFSTAKTEDLMAAFIPGVQSLAKAWGYVNESLNDYFDQFDERFKAAIDWTEALTLSIDLLGGAFDKVKEFFSGRGDSAFDALDMEVRRLSRRENFEGFQGKLGQDLNSVLNNLVPMAPIASPMGGPVIDQRRTNFVVNISGGDPVEVKAALNDVIVESGVTKMLTNTKTEIQTRNGLL